MRRLYDALPVFAQELACGWEGRRRLRERFTPHFHATLAAWDAGWDAPAPAQRAAQARALARLVEHARTRTDHWAALPPPHPGDDPEEAIARTLASIPPLDKETLRTRGAALRARGMREAELVLLRTSGTTGTALEIWQTRDRLAEWYAVAWRQRRRAGVALDDPHFTFGGQPIVPLAAERPPFWRRNRPGRQVLFSTYHLAPRFLPAYVDAVHRLPARYVQGYPSALQVVAAALLDAGRPFAPGRLRAVFPSSETLLPFQRATLERAFAAPVLDYYSSAETAVAMTGCGRGRLHVDSEFCLVEVEDGVRGEEDGVPCETGPLLVTGLGTDAMPLLRYRIGDVGTRALSPCPCGRPGDSYLRVDGRIEDYVVTPDGRRIGRMDHVFKDQLEVAEAQFVQDAADALVLLVVPRPGYGDTTERQLREAVRGRVGDALRLEIRRVERIPREPNGKLRAVRSRVGRLEAAGPASAAVRSAAGGAP